MKHGLPLDGLVVLDLTRLLPGGYATMVLRDLGASVIKIENPAGGDELRAMPPFRNGTSVLFSAINRGKRSVALNLKHHKGRDIFLKLAAKADVVVEGFRPGVTARLGVDYESVRSVNSGIVYCSITGYGQDGAYSDKAGHDLNYLGYAGVASLTGRADGALSIPGVQIADIGCGALMAVIGILGALYRRSVTGEGGYIDVSMLDGAVAWMPFQVASYFATGETPEPGNWILTGRYPCYNLYKTKDQKYVAVSALERKFWVNLCSGLGQPELTEKQFAERADGEAVKNALGEIFLTKTRDEWVELFSEKDACVGPVYTLDEAVRDPQVRARGLVECVECSQPYVRFPVKLQDTVLPGYQPAPVLGEHTNETLLLLGYDQQDVRELAAARTVLRADH